MRKVYTVVAGDTYEKVARKKYGDDQKAGRIRRSNPGADDPLIAGTTLVIPDISSADDVGGRSADTPNEVALTIGGERFRLFTSISIQLSLDAVATVDVEAPFEPDNAEFRSAFKPLSFQSATVDVGGDRLFTGVMVDVAPSVGSGARVVSASCYAAAGVLGDCTAPASAYPLEWDDVALGFVAESMGRLFGISTTLEGDTGATFERLALNPGDKVLSWLAGLAAQRGFVISATPDGGLWLRKAITGGIPVADLEQGTSPVLSVVPAFSPQGYYSAITGISPTIVGIKGPQHTAKNPHLPGVIRPYTFASVDTVGADLPASVDSKIGRMFGNVVSYDVSVSTWRNPSGGLWSPNTLVALTAPGAMVYRRYIFLVRSVTLLKTAGKESAVLNLVLPGAFAGEAPETMPWDE